MITRESNAHLVTGATAAREAGVEPCTIRKWVQRSYLTPAGRQGRSHLYRLADVFAAERRTRRQSDP